MADEKGVRIDSGPETLAMQWMFKDGKLSSVATGQVLGLGVRCRRPPKGLKNGIFLPKGCLRLALRRRRCAQTRRMARSGFSLRTRVAICALAGETTA